MTSYSSSTVPWYEYKYSITKVVFGEGVTSIGDYAFFGCSGLTSVEIPDTVETMGMQAFANCTSLRR